MKLTFLIVSSLFFNFFLLSASLHAEKASLASHAEKLVSLEAKYVEALKQKDYKTLYELQHPLFKALVAFEQFKEKEGRVLLEMEKIDRITQLPGIFTYNPFLRYKILEFDVDSVYIDDSGRYSKVETFVSKDFSVSLPVAGPMIISNKVHHYWERVDDQWYVLAKHMDVPAMHVSGTRTGYDDRERRMLLPEEYAIYKKVFQKEKKQ